MSHDFDRTKADICTFICKRFLETGEGTTRKVINVRFRQPDLLNEMVHRDSVLEQSRTGADVLLPRLAAFVVASDAKLLETVKNRLVVVVQAMKELYFSDESNTSSMYSWQRFLDEARKFDPTIDKAALRFGFLLSSDLGVMGGYQQGGDDTFQAVGVSERILTVDDPKAWLDARLEELKPKPPSPPADLPEINGESFGFGEPAPLLFRGTRSTAAVPAEFPFMKSPDLKRVVERDYAELKALDPKVTPKSVLIMAGAVIEGLLLDALLCVGKRGFEDFASGSTRNLADMIGPAKTEGIIREDRLTDVIRKYRALAHPAREVRDVVAVDERDAQLAASAVEVTLREISQWHCVRKTLPSGGNA